MELFVHMDEAVDHLDAGYDSIPVYGIFYELSRLRSIQARDAMVTLSVRPRLVVYLRIIRLVTFVCALEL